MKTVKVSKDQLKTIITQNRNNHRDQFEKAFEGYRQECIKLLGQNLDQLKSGNKIVVKFYEVAPEDHTDDYDTVLNMLEMSVDDVIELTHQEFSEYVENDWQWKKHWASMNSKYITQ